MKPWICLLFCFGCAPTSRAADPADAASVDSRRLTVTVRDADSGQPLACRLYLHSADGQPLFFHSLADDGSAVRYEKQNWGNKSSVEYHTTVSPHPCATDLPPGTYTLVVERGKTYFPVHREFEVADRDVSVDVPLKSWIDMASRGWYSGDAHIHRELDDLRNVVLAEDINVVFPLTYWVTHADRAPSSGDKNIGGNLPSDLIQVDDTHVIWPRNTEYEIFSVAQQRHTLGALFVLGHRDSLQLTVPPWQPVVQAAQQADPDVLLDMDKLAWPFAMMLPTIAPQATYELANNHMWRTEFAFRQWYTPAPPFIQPPFGGTEGNERQWIDLTLGMYYTLLNCGFRLPPSAGTANGVHPVPAGFGRVYVHLPDGFGYQDWRRGLKQGRSFVTTGPMLLATVDGHDPGHVFEVPAGQSKSMPIRIEVISQQPLAFGEVMINGRPEVLSRMQNQPTDSGGFRSVIEQTVDVSESGWLAIRVWEDRDQGRVRFAHTAPWYVQVGDQPVRPTHDEKQYLVQRMTDEIQRSRPVVSAAAMQEYQQALDFYRALPVRDDRDQVQRNARPLTTKQDHDRWLENMLVHHRLTAQELRLATGISIEEAESLVAKHTPQTSAASESKDAASGKAQPEQQQPIRVLAYPGGRHPRRGFLDGARDPQRETKVSVFAPWPDGGYAVVDVPEAIFSNLGLTYLAHQHIPTIWDDQAITLPPLEWREIENELHGERVLPNGIRFGSHVQSTDDGVRMQMWFRNQTDQPLSGLRSQVCVMLSGLNGFNTQVRRQQVIDGPFVAVRDDQGDRWVITAWTPNHRSWTNPPVPCIHSDPIFPDCAVGQMVGAQGGLWFYQGDDVASEIARLRSAHSNWLFDSDPF